MTIPMANLNGHLDRIFTDIPVFFMAYAGTADQTLYSGVLTSPIMTEVVEVGGEQQTIDVNLFVRPSDGFPASRG